MAGDGPNDRSLMPGANLAAQGMPSGLVLLVIKRVVLFFSDPARLTPYSQGQRTASKFGLALLPLPRGVFDSGPSPFWRLSAPGVSEA